MSKLQRTLKDALKSVPQDQHIAFVTAFVKAQTVGIPLIPQHKQGVQAENDVVRSSISSGNNNLAPVMSTNDQTLVKVGIAQQLAKAPENTGPNPNLRPTPMQGPSLG